MGEQKICEEALMLTGTSPSMYSDHCWAKNKIVHKRMTFVLFQK